MVPSPGLSTRYGHLVSFASRDQFFVNLGLQHRRALALPYAVDGCKTGQAVFHITPTDGCSSLLAPSSDFQSRNQKQSAQTQGISWPKWVEESCSVLRERRVVPCVPLRTVIGDWLGGLPVARVKVDAQGMDLHVVQSAGPLVTQLRYVMLEVQSPLAAPLYEGQLFCPEIVSSMRMLGFVLADSTRPMRSVCNSTSFAEQDVHFIRQELRPSWRTFYKDYEFCQHFAAAGDCGGPYCIAPRLDALVNRTGGCEGQVMDRIEFGPEATGMVLLRVSEGCGNHVDLQLHPSTVEPEKHSLTLIIHQGSVGRRECPVQVVKMAIMNFTGEGPSPRQRRATDPYLHMLRFRIGRGDDREFYDRVVLLPGILALLLQLRKGCSSCVKDSFA